jgi:hypothetical protein
MSHKRKYEEIRKEELWDDTNKWRRLKIVEPLKED